MKHDTIFLEQLQQEMPRKNLSPKATQRFEDTYRMLGVQKEAPVRKRGHKGLWITATAACLCCGMLFGVNAVFPAFAESLPGVGRFFRTVNGAFSYNGNTKSPHGEFLDTYDTQTVNVVDSNGEYSVEIQQAYSDGKNASFSLDLMTPLDSWETYESLTLGSDLEIWVNGAQVNFVFNTTLYREESGHYVGAISFELPRSAENGEQLDLEISIGKVTYPDKYVYGGYIDIDVALKASFSVTTDTSRNKFFASEAEDNGYRVHSVESSPTSTLISVTLSEEYTISTNPVLLTMDNVTIPFSYGESYQFGGYNLQQGVQDCTLYFDGTPADAQQLVFRIYQNDYQSVLAEFTIDLTNQTVVPSTTYEDGGALDLNNPFHYKYLSYFTSGDPRFTNHFALENVSYAKENSSWEIGLLTNEAYKEILVETYTATGELIGSTVSAYGTINGQANWFWDENSPWWGGNHDPKDGSGGYPNYAYRVELQYEKAYMPAINETITVVVKDNATGEELLRQDLTLDHAEY